MSSPRYTKRRGQVYWFQMRVPAALQRTYGKRLLQESLKTTDARVAAPLALQLAGKWKRRFHGEISDNGGMSSPRDIYLQTLEEVERIKRRKSDREEQEMALDLLWDGVMDRALSALGYGHPSEVPDDKWPRETQAALEAIKNARAGVVEPPTEYGLPFSEVASRFIADRQRDGESRLTRQTQGQMEAVYRLFSDSIDDAPLGTVQRAAVASFFDEVKLLRSNWGRQPGVKERTLNELVALSAVGAGPHLSARTVNRYVSSLNQLWKWAERRGEASGANPFERFSERVKRNRVAHMPWTADAISSYFATMKDIGQKGQPNPFHWLPKIALLSGMRLNEICSIEVTDIKVAEGVTYFDVPAGKTESSIRVVPVHDLLHELLDLAPKEGFLFPTLRPAGPDSKRSWNIGKRLNRRFRSIPGASDFHAFRKNVAEVFERLGVPETASAQILGHFKPGMTYGVYSPNGLTLPQRKKLVDQLETLVPSSRRKTQRSRTPRSTR